MRRGGADIRTLQCPAREIRLAWMMYGRLMTRFRSRGMVFAGKGWGGRGKVSDTRFSFRPRGRTREVARSTRAVRRDFAPSTCG